MAEEAKAEPEKKKGFWDIFAKRTWATKSGKLENVRFSKSREDTRPESRRLSEAPLQAISSLRRRTRRPDPSAAKGKGREVPNGSPYELGPLSQWPPPGVSSLEELPLGRAMELVCHGTPVFRGHKRPVPHSSDHYYSLYATAAGNRGGETDAANHHNAMVQLMTLRLLGSSRASAPWESLEQPSRAFWFGTRPGTVTLNHLISMSSVLPPQIALRDPGVAPREVELDEILERLRDLESGLEEDDPDLMYKNLYRRFLRDPDKASSPHKSLDKQITDLIVVLSRADWIDFTNPRNQIATKFIFDTDLDNHETYTRFFYQLLLSLELELRINSRRHQDDAKEKLMLHMPPTIQWDLALAKRWRKFIRIGALGKAADEVRLRMLLRKRQVKMLRRFAQVMKWPNLADTLDVLRQREADSTLDLISSDAMAFFSGLVLPGPTFPFLIMNSLVDVDPDRATDELALLTHLQPSCGFQYRGSYTYWTASSIVGKVLAPTCHSLAGWIGPARPTVDLARSQIARIRSWRPRHRPVLTPEDALSITERSDPLGPPAPAFPVAEYTLAVPDTDPTDADGLAPSVRVELLGLRPCADRPADRGLHWFDASVQFAIDGVSWPLRLDFDVDFVCAWPCSDGPHPLFFDYAYTVAKAAELVSIRDWNGLYGAASSSRPSSPAKSPQSSAAVPVGSGSGGRGGPGPNHGNMSTDGNGNANGRGDARGGSPSAGADAEPSQNPADEERVLVVEAFGVPDNEVLARAWCSHWGLSAVVADIRKTCMACAIREAYAATLTVVILVDDEQARAES